MQDEGANRIQVKIFSDHNIRQIMRVDVFWTIYQNSDTFGPSHIFEETADIGNFQTAHLHNLSHEIGIRFSYEHTTLIRNHTKQIDLNGLNFSPEGVQSQHDIEQDYGRDPATNTVCDISRLESPLQYWLEHCFQYTKRFEFFPAEGESSMQKKVLSLMKKRFHCRIMTGIIYLYGNVRKALEQINLMAGMLKAIYSSSTMPTLKCATRISIKYCLEQFCSFLKSKITFLEIHLRVGCTC